MSIIEASLAQPFALSPSTAAIQTKLSGTVADFNRTAAALDAEAAALRSSADGGWTLTDETIAGQLRSRKLDLLGAEIDLRGTIESFHELVASNDQPAAVDLAIKACEAAKDSVRAKLVGIGFEMDRGIEPLLFRHPSISGTSQALDAIRSHEGTLRQQRNLNLAAIEKCQEALADIKAKSLAVLST